MDYTLLSIVSHIILLFSQYSPVSEVQVFLFKLRCFLVEAITRGLEPFLQESLDPVSANSISIPQSVSLLLGQSLFLHHFNGQSWEIGVFKKYLY